MIDEIKKEKLKRTGIYFVVFTILFIIFSKTLQYTIPFVIGIILASSTKNANIYLQKKLKISSGIAALITTTVIYAILGVIITMLVYLATSEIIRLISKVPSMEKLSGYIQILIFKAGEILGQIEPQVVAKIYEYLQALLASALNFVIGVLNRVLSIIFSLPSMFMVAIISFLATYFFSKDYVSFGNKFFSIFSSEGQTRMRDIIKSAIAMTIGYIKAYALVVLITFIQTFIGFSILKLEYAFILAATCAILDILPIIGTIILYVPLIIYKISMGEIVTAIGLIIVYLIVTVIRQVIEPKIVSHQLDMHPVLTLAAIFIGVKVNGLAGMIYFIALLVGFKVLEKVKVI